MHFSGISSNKRRWSLGLFSAAVILLAGSAVGSAKAALTIYSEHTYTAELDMSDIGVTLLENGNAVAKNGETGILLEHLLDEDESLIPGKSYDEVLAVQNTGSIDEYVRVNIVRRWIRDQIPDTELSPSLIELELNQADWIVDAEASTPERTVAYLKHILPQGETSPPIFTKLCISRDVTASVKENREDHVLTYTYVYDGIEFCIEATVEAVQGNHIADAAGSAWGVDLPEDVTIAPDSDGEMVSGQKYAAVYKKDAKNIKTNYSSKDIARTAMAMQPGDTVSFRVDLKNESDRNTNWYIINTVGKTLEDSEAAGGAYAYTLTYFGENDEARVLYQSDRVGGDGVNGLYDISDELGDYVWMGSIAPGEAGYVVMEITLDGETHGNDYWKTFARLNMDFALDDEKLNISEPTKVIKIIKKAEPSVIRSRVKTGDQTPLLMLAAAALISGIGCMAAGIIIAKRRRD